MSYPKLNNIIIGGKKYIDITALENAVKPIYPLKTHSLRRMARYGKIPYKRIGMSRKDWFDLDAVKAALHLVIEDDPGEIDPNTFSYETLNRIKQNFIETDLLAEERMFIDKRKGIEEDYLADL